MKAVILFALLSGKLNDLVNNTSFNNTSKCPVPFVKKKPMLFPLVTNSHLNPMIKH